MTFFRVFGAMRLLQILSGFFLRQNDFAKSVRDCFGVKMHNVRPRMTKQPEINKTDIGKKCQCSLGFPHSQPSLLRNKACSNIAKRNGTCLGPSLLFPDLSALLAKTFLSGNSITN